MPVRFTASKEDIKGLPAMPEGLVSIRLSGFKPQWSSKKDSYNLNPQLRVVNNAEYNDRVVFYSLNTKAKFMWKDFCHAFGVECVEDAKGEMDFPGDFGDHSMDEPEKWEYQGPLLGQVAQVYLVQLPARDKNGNPKPEAEPRNDIKYFVCALPGCTVRHSDNLIRS